MALLKEHEIKSPYDLREMLWYVIPGATLLLLIFLFEYWFSVEIRGVELNFKQNKNIVEKIQEKDSIKITEKALSQIAGNANDPLGKLNPNQTIQRQLLENIHTPVFTALTITHTGENIFGENWVFGAMYLLLLLSICYVLGHISYMIGTFLFERFLIMKGYSYPYRTLLLLKESERGKNQREIEASKAFYIAVWFWVALVFLSMYLLRDSVGYPHYELYTFIILGIFIVFLVIPAKMKFVLSYITRWKIEQRNRNSSEGDGFKPNSPRPVRSGYLFWPIWSILLTIVMYIFNPHHESLSTTLAWYFVWNNFWYIISIIAIVIFITEIGLRLFARDYTNADQFNDWLSRTESDREINYDRANRYDREKVSYEGILIKIYNFLPFEFDRFSNNYFHTQNAFDSLFREKYDEAFNYVYGCNYEDLKPHNYWFSKLFVAENSLYLNQQINFWENASRFAKSLSASFLIACLYCSFSFMLQYANMQDIIGDLKDLNYSYKMLVLYLIPLGYFLLTALIVRYYMYVYDNRFNRLVLRSFVSLVLPKCKKEKPEIKVISG